MKTLLIFGCFVFAAVSCFAQTNVVAAPIPVSNAPEALGALLHFCGLSTEQIAVLALLTKAALNYYRNFALKNKTAGNTNVVERFIAHAAADSLPGEPPKTP